MALYDTVWILDDLPALACPEGHVIRCLQTKDLEGLMRDYLVYDQRLYLADASDRRVLQVEPSGWRVESTEAVHEFRYRLREIHAPGTLRLYASCSACAPVLLRTDAHGRFGDFVSERELFVDFAVRFRGGQAPHVQRHSGTREDLKRELRASGSYVLDDDHPLARAHDQIKRAREEADRAAELADGERR